MTFYWYHGSFHLVRGPIQKFVDGSTNSSYTLQFTKLLKRTENNTMYFCTCVYIWLSATPVKRLILRSKYDIRCFHLVFSQNVSGHFLNTSTQQSKVYFRCVHRLEAGWLTIIVNNWSENVLFAHQFFTGAVDQIHYSRNGNHLYTAIQRCLSSFATSELFSHRLVS